MVYSIEKRQSAWHIDHKELIGFPFSKAAHLPNKNAPFVARISTTALEALLAAAAYHFYIITSRSIHSLIVRAVIFSKV